MTATVATAAWVLNLIDAASPDDLTPLARARTLIAEAGITPCRHNNPTEDTDILAAIAYVIDGHLWAALNDLLARPKDAA